MYIKLTNGQPTPYTIGQLRKDNPNTSFPKQVPEETLALYDVYPYTIDPMPVYDTATQKIEEGDIVEVNGAWVRQWNLIALTTEELTKKAEERLEQATRAIQRHLDDEARKKRYDNIVSACSYAGYPNAYQAEGQAAIEWRGAVWSYATNVWAEVALGTRSEPTIEELINELPTITWPA